MKKTIQEMGLTLHDVKYTIVNKLVLNQKVSVNTAKELFIEALSTESVFDEIAKVVAKFIENPDSRVDWGTFEKVELPKLNETKPKAVKKPKPQEEAKAEVKEETVETTDSAEEAEKPQPQPKKKLTFTDLDDGQKAVWIQIMNATKFVVDGHEAAKAENADYEMPSLNDLLEEIYSKVMSVKFAKNDDGVISVVLEEAVKEIYDVTEDWIKKIIEAKLKKAGF